MIYSKQGRSNDAERLLEQVLAANKAISGDKYLQGFQMSRSRLATTYGNEGNWDEAQRLEEQLLEAMRMELGDEHPTTLDLEVNLATTCFDQELFGQATDLLLHATKASETVLGAGHPETVKRKFLLTVLHREVMRLEGGEEDFQDSLLDDNIEIQST
ncbi:uncharacterized protein N7496_001730 [Penicillium cataractarum]|uniref:Kinesin light chain n=1 Tax=Penicillium cataractarum TaxID=2100454 RepID=A0A9W9VWJ1_9EURO|nr:uncharacterized protein N7496_001730 [Penicillium cataractarum]KAJ5390662.1 hypothetical protein N7496_001730 [Penicillium cataractarum]